MKLSVNEYARRKRVIRDATAKEDVDIILGRIGQVGIKEVKRQNGSKADI